MTIRRTFLLLLRTTGQLQQYILRAQVTHIGAKGEVTESDLKLAEELKLKPLNRFQKWLLRPYIEADQQDRRAGIIRIPII